MAKKKKFLNVQDTLVNWQIIHEQDYICLTDMAKGFEGDPRDFIRNWLRTGATIEFLGVWEQLHNPQFNVVEFHHIKSQFTKNTFLMSLKNGQKELRLLESLQNQGDMEERFFRMQQAATFQLGIFYRNGRMLE